MHRVIRLRYVQRALLVKAVRLVIFRGVVLLYLSRLHSLLFINYKGLWRVEIASLVCILLLFLLGLFFDVQVIVVFVHVALYSLVVGGFNVKSLLAH